MLSCDHVITHRICVVTYCDCVVLYCFAGARDEGAGHSTEGLVLARQRRWPVCSGVASRGSVSRGCCGRHSRTFKVRVGIPLPLFVSNRFPLLHYALEPRRRAVIRWDTRRMFAWPIEFDTTKFKLLCLGRACCGNICYANI